MVFKSLAALLLVAASVIGAPTASGSSSLEVSLKAAQDSVSTDNFIVSATVSNPTDSDVRVVKYNTLLDENPSRSFRLYKDGAEVGFRGFRITPNLKEDSVYTIIPAKQSVTVEHNLGGRFDFGTSGTGTYTVTPIAHFQLVPNTNANLTDSQIVDLDGSSLSITVDVNEVNTSFTIQTTTPTCPSDSGKLNQLRSALTEARALAGGVATDITSHPNSGALNTYFGANSRDTLWWNFDRIAGDLPDWGNRILTCTDTPGGCANPDWIAYTLIVTSGDTLISSDIYACNSFWGLPGSSNICSGEEYARGTVVLHELSHAVVRTDDVIYGCSGAAGLSDANKINNADNYRCMANQIYRDYNC